MPETTIDLKKLIVLINQGKDMEANLILDEGCLIYVNDPKPLVKVINYFINYLQPLTNLPLEIGLDLRESEYLLTIMAYTEEKELPEISDRLPEVLKDYAASYELRQDTGTDIQFKILFKKE